LSETAVKFYSKNKIERANEQYCASE
jgi:hypothetical protein